MIYLYDLISYLVLFMKKYCKKDLYFWLTSVSILDLFFRMYLLELGVETNKRGKFRLTKRRAFRHLVINLSILFLSWLSVVYVYSCIKHLVGNKS